LRVRPAHIASARTARPAAVFPITTVAAPAAAVTAVVRPLRMGPARPAPVLADVDAAPLDLRARQAVERAVGQVLRQVDEGVRRPDVDRPDLGGGETALIRDRADDAAGLDAVVPSDRDPVRAHARL